jgi:gamma-glutamylaminecyclotransferase
MHQRVFVYGTLLRGQVNHDLLAGAACLGPHRTAAAFTLYNLGTYPGLVRGGITAVVGEVYRLDGATLRRLDELEEYPRLYGRLLIPTPFGGTWVYHYRGRVQGCQVIRSGDWRGLTRDPGSVRAGAIRNTRNAKTRAVRQALRAGAAG